jgi:hypothetical protein
VYSGHVQRKMWTTRKEMSLKADCRCGRVWFGSDEALGGAYRLYRNGVSGMHAGMGRSTCHELISLVSSDVYSLS